MNVINPFVIFEAELDKDRRILNLTIRKEEKDDVCFFRFQHQPIDCHPEQVQQVYRFLSHYWNEEDKRFEFKGVKLNSTGQQIVNLQNRKINKEVGLLKRRQASETVSKEEKQKEKLNNLKKKYEEQEAEFQLRRAKRIAKVMADMTTTL